MPNGEFTMNMVVKVELGKETLPKSSTVPLNCFWNSAASGDSNSAKCTTGDDSHRQTCFVRCRRTTLGCWHKPMVNRSSDILHLLWGRNQEGVKLTSNETVGELTQLLMRIQNSRDEEACAELWRSVYERIVTYARSRVPSGISESQTRKILLRAP